MRQGAHQSEQAGRPRDLLPVHEHHRNQRETHPLLPTRVASPPGAATACAIAVRTQGRRISFYARCRQFAQTAGAGMPNAAHSSRDGPHTPDTASPACRMSTVIWPR